MGGTVRYSLQRLESHPQRFEKRTSNIYDCEKADFNLQMSQVELNDALLNVYEKTIGSMRRVPRIFKSPQGLQSYKFHPGAAFISLLIDGNLSYEEIVGVSSFPKVETCRILSKLLLDGVIA